MGLGGIESWVRIKADFQLIQACGYFCSEVEAQTGRKFDCRSRQVDVNDHASKVAHTEAFLVVPLRERCPGRCRKATVRETVDVNVMRRP